MPRFTVLAAAAFIALSGATALEQRPATAQSTNLTSPPAISPQEQRRAARRAERKPMRDACRAEAIKRGLPRGDVRQTAIRNCMRQ